jgi:hypothetical protein
MAKPKFKGTTLIDPERIYKIQEYILGEYEAKFVVDRKTMRDAKRYYQITSVKRLYEKVYVYETERISGLKKDYIKSLQAGTYNNASILRKVKSFSLFPTKGRSQDYDNYYNILNLRNYSKVHWRQLIQEFQLIIKSLTDTFVNVDTMDVPQSFIDSRKKQRIVAGKASGTPGVRRVKLKGEIVCKQAEELERWVDGKNCKWVSTTYDMAKFHQNKFILVYGKQEDAETMDKWFKAVKDHKIHLAVLSERELKVVNAIQLHNLMPFSKFMEGKNKPFQRVATACLIDKMYDQYRDVFRRSDCLASISKDLCNKVESLHSYRESHFKGVSDEFRDIIIEHAKEIKAFDLSIYSTVVEIETICKKLPFLNSMLGNMRYRGDVDNNDPMMQALVDLFKYHKHRIDWKNYNIRLNEDLPLEETLTSETVEELITQG